MVFVVSSVLIAWKESRQGRQKIARGVAERNPGDLWMKPSNEPYTLSGTAALNEAQVLAPWLNPL